MKVSITTLGCKVNQYESQAMLELLQNAGFTLAQEPQEADVVLINSCTVTAQSDQKVRQAMHRARRKNPGCAIVLTGCMPQAFPDVASRFEEADIILGNSNRAALLPSIMTYLGNHQRIVNIEPYLGKDNFEKMQVRSFGGRTRAFLKIEDGCNRFCSYCIIPYARGRVRSKPLSDLKEEVAALSKAGYKEVVLVGINLSAYGQDLGLHLCDAVEAACAADGISRVRLGSLEPEQMEKHVIERLARQKKLCPQFHLSLQSGCDATLRRMNRHYDTALYGKIVNNLRASFENAAITTDIMVGFPGETQEEFTDSLAFAEKIGFSKVHVFAYSRRPGTRAAEAPGQLTNAVKEQRSREMIALTTKTRRAFLQAQVGLTEAILFESTVHGGMLEGYTMNYTPVRVKADKSLCGKLCTVRITGVLDDCCTGEII